MNVDLTLIYQVECEKLRSDISTNLFTSGTHKMLLSTRMGLRAMIFADLFAL